MILGVYLRYIKNYTASTFIPFAKNNIESFTALIGENGAGKSAVLEALDGFFNGTTQIINHQSKKSGGATFPFVAPLFLVPKSEFQKNESQWGDDVKKMEDTLEQISKKFWTTKDNLFDGFIQLRNNLRKYKNDHYLFLIGVNPNTGKASFTTSTISTLITDGLNESTFSKEESEDHLLWFVKELYNFLYLPVEMRADEFTKLESTQMQQLLGEDHHQNIISEINKSKLLPKIQRELNSLCDEINKNLVGLEYKTHGRFRVYKDDFAETIIETYFGSVKYFV